MRVAKLEIHHVGPFGDLVLNFLEKPAGIENKAEIHILTGENGTGKTTILEVMADCLKDLMSRQLLTKCRNTIKKNASAAISIPGNNSHASKFNKVAIMGGGLRPFNNNEKINSYWEKIKNPWGDPAFSFAFFAYAGYRRISNIQISGIQELDEHPLKNALDFQYTADPQPILQWIANTIAAEAIANTQNEKEEAKQRREAIDRLEKSIGNIIDKKISFKLETKPYAVRIEVDSERLDFNHLPDGLKSIVSWLSDLLMRMDRVKWKNEIAVFERNFILFLDEIEVHMHPAWQRKILPVVQNLFPNAQIFISTHSPFVVGSVDGAWIHKLVKPNGDSQLAEGYPKLSEDARSFRYWLDEVFDITSEYGVEADKQLKHFYALRDEVFKGGNGIIQESLIQAGQALADQSQEMRQIIEMELRQINRRLSLQLGL